MHLYIYTNSYIYVLYLALGSDASQGCFKVHSFNVFRNVGVADIGMDIDMGIDIDIDDRHRHRP